MAASSWSFTQDCTDELIRSTVDSIDTDGRISVPSLPVSDARGIWDATPAFVGRLVDTRVLGRGGVGLDWIGLDWIELMMSLSARPCLD